MKHLNFDTIVIGSGLAGLTAAFHSSRFGSVAIVTKSELDTSNSWFAQGGIAAAISEEDSPENHLQDTLVAGRGLCDYDAVEILVNEGRVRVGELIELGMPFDRDREGNIVLGLEGGHSNRRILHAGGDATGKELTRFLLKKVVEIKNIFPFEFTAVVRFLGQNGCVTGVQGLDFVTGENILFSGKAVIVATGGLSRIYSRSTNPHTATGDGIALAYQSGATLADLEFIQFHPSALYIPGKEAFLISEAVRGEGAWLLNTRGERFMTGVHPLAELAPRDIVAYSIFREMQKTGDSCVYLSLKHLNAETILRRFSTISQKLAEYGIDMTQDPIPVAPAAHYMVGGIRSGHDGETNVRGLFVCGEAASTGVMGANRLASNSLLECLVFGKRASEIASQLKGIRCETKGIRPFTVSPENEKTFLDFKNEMAGLMTNQLGIIRSQEGMEAALARFEEIYRITCDHQNDYNILKIKNLAEICRLIARAALLRKESRGGHIREDYPAENDHYREHILQQQDHEPVFQPVVDKNDSTALKLNEKELESARKLIILALAEDIGSGDVTTDNLIPSDVRRAAFMKAKEDGVIAGLEVAEMVFRQLDPSLEWEPLKKDGEKITKGDVIVKFSASFRALLSGERTALNFLQRMSGIATIASRFTEAVKGGKTRILDTRKTLPGFRLLDKYGVRAGGAVNHRFGLYDMVMIKDNHIAVAGGIRQAVENIRARTGTRLTIEVETTSIREVEEALAAKADIIMLDNMDNETMTHAVTIIGNNARTEASGNITLDRIAGVAATGVDYISAGALTHSVKALDISQEIIF